MPGRSPLFIVSAITWTALHQLQSGYHMSALNGVQASLTCKEPPSSDFPEQGFPKILPSWAVNYIGPLTGCVAMTGPRFGVVVAMFTLGALVGALAAQVVTKAFGRVGSLRVASTLCLLGSLGFAVANAINVMIFARLLVGLGSGIISVTTPLLLTELKPSLRNNLGILNQFAMVSGMLVAQSLSIPLAKQFAWRYVLILGLALALFLLVSSLFFNDAGMQPTKKGTPDEETPLVEQEEVKHLSLKEVARSDKRVIRTGFACIIACTTAQQLCGMSPLVYFSTGILRPVFKKNAGYVAIAILVVMLPAALLSIPLMPRLGSKKILVYTHVVMATALVALAMALNLGQPIISCVAVLIYVLAYGIGPGTVTWVVLSEVLPPEARTAAGSMGMSLNAVMSFIVSSTFLPLQQILMVDEDTGTGNVFFVFVGTCIFFAIAIRTCFRRYEKAKAQARTEE